MALKTDSYSENNIFLCFDLQEDPHRNSDEYHCFKITYFMLKENIYNFRIVLSTLTGCLSCVGHCPSIVFFQYSYI